MTERQKVERRRIGLGEIREIMNSMKTLAYLESRKLARFLPAQRQVVVGIEQAATDLLTFYPDVLPETLEVNPVCILLGTERGFCGDFNHGLLRYWEQVHKELGKPLVIGIGHKLNTLLETEYPLHAALIGASVAEEVDNVLSQLTRELTDLQSRQPVVSLYCLYQSERGGIVMQKLLPPFAHLRETKVSDAYPPVINLSPYDLLLELGEHYLFSRLHEILFSSLAAENRQRIKHLEGTVHHLDEEAQNLVRKSNILRQEEIIEEIEVILLSAGSLESTAPG